MTLVHLAEVLAVHPGLGRGVGPVAPIGQRHVVGRGGAGGEDRGVGRRGAVLRAPEHAHELAADPLAGERDLVVPDRDGVGRPVLDERVERARLGSHIPPLPSLGMVNISASIITVGVKVTVDVPVIVKRSERLA